MLLVPFERLIRFTMNRRGVTSRLIQTHAGPQHVYDAPGFGDLPPIVLLHGIGAGATSFARLIAHLIPHARRVLAPEAPGHGFSGAPTVKLDARTLFSSIAELLDRELDEPAIVFGNSLGGASALYYALGRPERVKALILSSPAGAPMAPEPLSTFLDTFALDSPAKARAFLGRLYHQAPWYTSLVARDVQAVFGSEAIRGILDSVVPNEGVPIDRLRALPMPILFLWGKSEKIMPPSHLEFYRSHLPPHAEIVEPDEFGHCPHLDRPGALARYITDFARRPRG